MPLPPRPHTDRNVRDRPLRIALVHSFYSSDEPSGENEQVLVELDALRRAGTDVALFDASTDDLRRQRGYRVRAAVRVATGRGQSPREAIAGFEPDVVHIHNLFPNFGRRWVADLDVPVVMTLHNYRFVCAAATLFRDGQVCTECPDGKRWAGVRHRCYRGSTVATLPLTLQLRGGPTADPVLARADRILCLSARQRGLLERAGIASGRLVDWTNFVPPDLIDDMPPDRRHRLRDGYLYVGRLTPEKGCLELVRHWPSDRLLRVVGDGPARADVAQAAAGKRVELLGRVSREDVIKLMRSSTALVIPSVWPEGSGRPLVYLEALACGLPTVVNRLCDVANQVEADGVGGVAADVPHMPDVARRVAADPTQTRRCRAAFEAKFGRDAWTTRMLGLYRSVVR